MVANTIGFDKETLEKNGRDYEDLVNAGIDIYNKNYDAARSRAWEIAKNNFNYAVDNQDRIVNELTKIDEWNANHDASGHLISNP